MPFQVAELVAKFKVDTSELRSAMQDAKRAVSTTSQEMQSLGRTMTIGVTAPLVAIGGAAIKAAGDFEQTKIAFTTMLGSAERAGSYLKELANFARKTPFELRDLEVSTRRLMAYGFEAKEVIPTLRVLGDATAALGGGSEMINRLTVALGQMRAKGIVSAQEMNQLAEQGIPAWELLSKAIGVSIPEAMEMAEKRLIRSSVAVPALMEGMNARFAGLMQQQSQTLLGQWSNFKDALNLTLRSVGEAILPLAKIIVGVMNQALAAVKLLAEGFSALPSPIKTTVAAIGALAASVGPALWGLGKLHETLANVGTMLRGSAFTTGIADMRGAIGHLRNAFSGLLSLLATPVGAWTAGIAAVVLILVQAYKHSEAFRGVVDKLWGGMKTGASAAWDVLKAVWGTLKDIFGPPVQAVFEQLQAAWANVKSAMQDVMTALRPLFEHLRDVWSQGLAQLRAAWDQVKDALQAFWAMAQPIFARLQEAWAALWPIIAPVLKNLLVIGVGGPVYVAVKAFIVALELVAAVLKTVAEVIDWFRNPLGNLKKEVTATASHMDKTWRGVAKSVTSWLTSLGQTVNAWATQTRHAVASWGENVLNFFRSLIPRLVQVGRDMWDGLKQGMKAKAQEVWDTVRNIGQNIINTIKGVLGIASPSKEFRSMGVNLMQGFMDGTNSMLPKLQGVVHTIAEGLKKAWEAVVNALGFGGTNISGNKAGIGGGRWLASEAAPSMRRILQQFPGIQVRSAGRTAADQARLVRQRGVYGQGGYAAPVGSSYHQAGAAVDLGNVTPEARRALRAAGWVDNVPREPWHFNYSPLTSQGSGRQVVAEFERRGREMARAEQSGYQRQQEMHSPSRVYQRFGKTLATSVSLGFKAESSRTARVMTSALNSAVQAGVPRLAEATMKRWQESLKTGRGTVEDVAIQLAQLFSRGNTEEQDRILSGIGHDFMAHLERGIARGTISVSTAIEQMYIRAERAFKEGAATTRKQAAQEGASLLSGFGDGVLDKAKGVRQDMLAHGKEMLDAFIDGAMSKTPEARWDGIAEPFYDKLVESLFGSGGSRLIRSASVLSDGLQQAVSTALAYQDLREEFGDDLIAAFANGVESGDWNRILSGPVGEKLSGMVQEAMRDRNWSKATGDFADDFLSSVFGEGLGIDRAAGVLSDILGRAASTAVSLSRLQREVGHDFLAAFAGAIESGNWDAVSGMLQSKLGEAIGDALVDANWEDAATVGEDIIDAMFGRGVQASRAADLLTQTIEQATSMATNLMDLEDEFGLPFLDTLATAIESGDWGTVTAMIRGKADEAAAEAVENHRLLRAEEAWQKAGEDLGARLADAIPRGVSRGLEVGNILSDYLGNAIDAQLNTSAMNARFGTGLVDFATSWLENISSMRDSGQRIAALDELGSWIGGQLGPVLARETNAALIEALQNTPESNWHAYGTTLLEQISQGVQQSWVTLDAGLQAVYDHVAKTQAVSSETNRIIDELGASWWRKFKERWQIHGLEEMRNMPLTAWEELMGRMEYVASDAGKRAAEAYNRQWDTALNLIASGGQISGGFGGIVSTVGQLIGGKTGTILGAVGQGLTGGGGIGSLLGGVGMAVGGPVGGIIGSLVGGLFGKGGKKKKDPQAEQAKQQLQQAGKDAVNEVARGLLKAYPDLIRMTTDLSRELASSVAGGIAKGSSALTGSIMDAIRGAKNGITREINGLTSSMTDAAFSSMSAVSGMYLEVRKAVYDAIGLKTSEEDEILRRTRETGEKIITNLINSMQARFPQLQGLSDKIRDLVTGALDMGWSDNADLMRRIGGADTVDKILDEFLKAAPGLARQKEYIRGLISNSLSQTANAWRGVAVDPASMPVVGEAIIDGLIEGLTNAEPRLEFVLESLTSVITSIMKERLAIASPSRVMENMGGNIVLGLIRGLGGQRSNLKLAWEGTIGLFNKRRFSMSMPRLTGDMYSYARQSPADRRQPTTLVIELDGKPIAQKTIQLIPGLMRLKGVTS